MNVLTIPVGSVSVDLIDDDRICVAVRREGSYEPETLAAWARICRPRSTVLDVGAYSGLFAIAATKLGAYAVAIEPMPVLVARINANAKLNKVAFTIHEAAASAETGKAWLGYKPDVYLTSGSGFFRTKAAKIMVKTITLDSLNLSDVSAVKMDVEGAEALVLNGARNLLSKSRPTLIIETGTRRKDEIARSLPDYRAGKLLDGRNLLLEAR